MSDEELEFQMIELGILKSCFCKYVVEIIDVFEDASVLQIVQEYIDGVDLCTYLKVTQRTEKLVKVIMRRILAGVGYLQSIGIVHRDIKLENIMIAKDSEGLPLPKIIDFGLSTILIRGETSRERYGTLVYSSPEILLGNYHY
jgi:serine/threonine protein kinase